MRLYFMPLATKGLKYVVLDNILTSFSSNEGAIAGISRGRLTIFTFGFALTSVSLSHVDRDISVTA